MIGAGFDSWMAHQGIVGVFFFLLACTLGQQER
jgi:hypothetical protein